MMTGGKRREDGNTKTWNLENKKSFIDETENIFQLFKSNYLVKNEK